MSSTLARRTAPAHSDLTYPSAAASRVLHLPSGDSIEAPWHTRLHLWESTRLHPAATARFTAEEGGLISLQPRWVATRDEEHAVSTLMANPWYPSA